MPGEGSEDEHEGDRSSEAANWDGRALGGEDRTGEGGPGAGTSTPGGPAGYSGATPDAGRLNFPKQSPLFHAQNAGRYERQRLIGEYEAAFNCRLIVMMDEVFPDSVSFVEDLIYDANPEQDLHLLLESPGGDGETAVRIIRSLQARCAELTVLVPDQAKSAATLLVLGAHHIVMGPTSDLGPVDPQFRVPRGSGGHDLVAAKDVLDAVDRAEKAIAETPATFPLHASLLADVSGLLVAQARSAILRTDDLVKECLAGCSGRSAEDVEALALSLHEPLIDLPKSHAAVFGAKAASDAGLPIRELDYRSEQWQLIWRLYMKYRTIPPGGIYEGTYASQHVPPFPH